MKTKTKKRKTYASPYELAAALGIHYSGDACQNYGHYDPVEDFGGPHYWVITTDPTSWEFDGWRAEAHIETEDLLGYLNALHMGGF